jgi:hypothetical protein
MSDYIGENDIVPIANKCDVCGKKPWTIYYTDVFMKRFYTCPSCKLSARHIMLHDWLWFSVFLILCACVIGLFVYMGAK